jgi:cyclohexanecarboxylate-CoA ligase
VASVPDRRPVVPTRPLDQAYRREGLWENRTIGSFERERAIDPDVCAVIDGDTTLTRAQLSDHIDALATALRDLGIGRGDVVLVQLPNWWETLVAFHAIIRLGAIVNPVVPIYRSAELSFILHQARPRAVITAQTFRGFDHSQMFAELIRELPPDDRPTLMTVRGRLTTEDAIAIEDLPPAREPVPETAHPDDISLLMYTSGTTASPKGVLHSHQTLVYETRSIARLYALTHEDTIFMASPLTHITGLLYGIILPPMLGSAVALLDVWEPAVAVDHIERTQSRFTVAATPFLQGLTDEYETRGHQSTLRSFACGGADIPSQLVHRAESVLGAGVYRVYGSTEFPTFSAGGPGDPLDKVATTDGGPIGPVESRLDQPVDGVGELLVAGPEMFHGYLDDTLNGDAFTDDGFFHTGDLASFDADGYVTIQGRLKDIIIRKGENISAREVEDLLIDHPDIADVAVVAVPDPESGERACAVVVTRAGHQIDLASITRFLDGSGIARQKYPEQVAVVAELPRTASGKVQKFVLRQQLTRDDEA